MRQVDITSLYSDRWFVLAVAQTWRKQHPDWTVNIESITTLDGSQLYYAQALMPKQ